MADQLSSQVFLVLSGIVFVVCTGFFAYYLFAAIYQYIKRKEVYDEHKSGVLLKVILPKYPKTATTEGENGQATEKTAELIEDIFSELKSLLPTDWRRYLTFRDTLSFEIVGTSTEIYFAIYCSRKWEKFIKDVIYSSYPDAEVYEIQDYFDPMRLGYLTYGYIRPRGQDYLPIKTYKHISSDSLNSLLLKMVNLKGNELVAVQVYATPSTGRWRRKAKTFLGSLPRLDDVYSTDPEHVSSPRLDMPLVEEMMREKIDKPSYWTGIRVISSADSKDIARQNYNEVVQTFSLYDLQRVTVVGHWAPPFSDPGFLSEYKLRLRAPFEPPFMKQQFVTSTEELATLFHFPGSRLAEVPKIAWQKYRTEPAPSDLPREGTFLGYNSDRGKRKEVNILRKDRRRHFYIIGQTGVGKSEFLKNMILQDIRNGEGVCFIDPHGDVAEDILTKIDSERADDVIYWNPGDVEYPVGLNIMDVDTVEAKNIVINSFIALLYKLYDPNRTGMMGPMLERTVRNVMLTAMEEEGSTLIEALRLLTSPSYAEQKVKNIKDPIIKTYWTEQMARTTEFHKSEALGYYVSKFDRFVSDVTMRNIIGQSKTAFDLEEIMNNQKILIINLSKGILGEENMSFLGMVLIPKFFIAAMGRSKMPEKDRKDFYLYVDEFQNFATPDFVNILSEARKYRLNLTVANQYISQIREDVRDAVFGNVGTIGAFRVGVEDARYIAKYFAPDIGEFDLINNGIGNMYLKLLIDGNPSEPFSLALDWREVQDVPKSDTVSEYIVERSRRLYARPRVLVEEEILQRAQFTHEQTNPAPRWKDEVKAEPRSVA